MGVVEIDLGSSSLYPSVLSISLCPPQFRKRSNFYKNIYFDEVRDLLTMKLLIDCICVCLFRVEY